MQVVAESVSSFHQEDAPLHDPSLDVYDDAPIKIVEISDAGARIIEEEAKKAARHRALVQRNLAAAARVLSSPRRLESESSESDVESEDVVPRVQEVDTPEEANDQKEGEEGNDDKKVTVQQEEEGKDSEDSEEEEEEEEEETMSKNEFVQWHKYQRGRAPSGDEMDQFHAMDVKGDGQIKMADFEKYIEVQSTVSLVPIEAEESAVGEVKVEVAKQEEEEGKDSEDSEEEEEEEEEETMSKNEFVQWHKYQRGRAPSGDEMDQFHAMDVKGDGQIKMADFEKYTRRSSSMLPVKEECGECDDCEEEKEVKAGEQLGAGKDTKPESSEDSSPAQMLHYATPDGGQSETAVADISQHISEGAITPETQIWIDGLADWMPLLEAQQAGEMTALRAVMKAADSDVKRAYLAQVWPLAGGDGGPVGEEGLLAVLLQMGFEPEEFEIGFVLAQVRSDLPPQPIPILLNHCGRVCRSTQTTTRP